MREPELEPEDLLRQQAASREREEELGRRLRLDMHSVMSTPQGRRLVLWLIDRVCATFGASYAGEPSQTAFNEGRRSIGIALSSRAQEWAPVEYVEMLREQLESQLLLAPEVTGR
jgi:hypothetical protein